MPSALKSQSGSDVPHAPRSACRSASPDEAADWTERSVPRSVPSTMPEPSTSQVWSSEPQADMKASMSSCCSLPLSGGSEAAGAEARTVPALEAAFVRARPAGPRSSGLAWPICMGVAPEEESWRNGCKDHANVMKAACSTEYKPPNTARRGLRHRLRRRRRPQTRILRDGISRSSRATASDAAEPGSSPRNPRHRRGHARRVAGSPCRSRTSPRIPSDSPPA